MENFFKRLGEKNPKSNNKRKIENLCFFIGILIITLILMKSIWKGNTEKSKLDEKENYTDEVLAIENNNQKNNEIENKLEDILSSIKNVGKVNVFINYSESTSVIREILLEVQEIQSKLKIKKKWFLLKNQGLKTR